MPSLLLVRLISCDQNTLFLATPSARFLTAILCDGEGLFAEALGGASRRVVGVDSIGLALDEVCRPPQLLELTWVAVVLH